MSAPTAILYDVHGNLAALEAVLVDARGAGAERFILGGDYALFGPQPADTLAALRALPEPAEWIRGNVDRWTAEGVDDAGTMEAVEACRSAIGDTLVTELGELPEQYMEGAVRYCHASPLSDLRSFLPKPDPGDDELLAGANERRIVFGHTHLAFRRTRPDGIELVNPGSVGMPLDGDPRAAYALRTARERLELRRVAYDHERSAALVREHFGEADWAIRSQRRLRSAQP